MNLEIFIARFHPLWVHLPIGFIILAAIMEALSRGVGGRFKNLDGAVAVALFCGALGAVGSALTGWLLSEQGGYDEDTLFWHRWLGISLAVLSLGAWAAKVGRIRISKTAISALIGVLIVMISVTGHLGGNLTHGEDYLLAYAPRFVQRMAGLETEGDPKGDRFPKQPQDILVYKHLVEPMLEEKCASCHSDAKANGGLKVTSLELLNEGGEGGEALVAGRPYESALFLRTSLPLSSKKFMPPKGDALSHSEQRVLEWWIREGASEEMSLASVEAPAEIAMLLMRDYGVDTKPKALHDVLEAPELGPEVWSAFSSQGIRADHLSMNHPMIDVRLESRFLTEPQLEALLLAKEQVTWLDLSGKAVADEHLKAVGELVNLTQLRLNNNPVSDAGVARLVGLQHLEALNLYGTEVSEEALESLRKLPSLKRLYLWQTSIDKEGLERMQEALPGVKVVGAANNS